MSIINFTGAKVQLLIHNSYVQLINFLNLPYISLLCHSVNCVGRLSDFRQLTFDTLPSNSTTLLTLCFFCTPLKIAIFTHDHSSARFFDEKQTILLYFENQNVTECYAYKSKTNRSFLPAKMPVFAVSPAQLSLSFRQTQRGEKTNLACQVGRVNVPSRQTLPAESPKSAFFVIFRGTFCRLAK